MSGSTEIYICKPGQSLKEGRIEYSSVTSREEAQADAYERCRLDPSIGKIAYYTVSEDGKFRLILSYANPRAEKTVGASTSRSSSPQKPAARREEPAKKNGIIRRAVDLLRK